MEYRIPVLSGREIEVLRAMIVAQRGIQLVGGIALSTDKGDMAKSSVSIAQYYDEMLEACAVWQWILHSTGTQACPCIVSTEIFSKFETLVNGYYPSGEEPEVRDSLRPGFRIIAETKPALIQAFKEAGITTREEMEEAQAASGPADKKMLN